MFFGVFLLAGLVAVYGMTIRPMLEVLAAQKWEATPCTVDSSGVAEYPGTGNHRPTYRFAVVYHYDFRGHPYSANRYSFAIGSTGGRASHQRVVNQYPPGTRTVCYVNPEVPTEAVIDRGLYPELAFGAFGLIFVLMGGFGMVFASRSRGAQGTWQKNVVPVSEAASGEWISLKPQVTPLGKFLGLLAFGVVWNGFIGFFFYLVFFSHDGSRAPFFAKAIVGVLALAGVAMLFAVVRSFLALFNPQVSLTARARGVPLGGEFQFQWNIAGRTEKLHQFRIVLEGREEAVYHSGKNVQTVTQVFAEIPVVASTEREILAQGQGRVTIPAGLMHTFNGPHNKILWRLRVRGEIPHWPDLEEDFPINVLPQGRTA